MLINDIANDILKKARKAYKKPIPVKIEGPVSTETVITSWENDHQMAKPGDYIVTGVKGEKYPLPASAFADYERDDQAGNDMYRKKLKVVYAFQIDSNGSVKTSRDEILEFQPGYYIVMESPENMWAVEGKVFEQTYEFA